MVGMHNLKINNIKLLNCLDKNFHYQNDLSWKTLMLLSTTVQLEQNCLISQDISRREISPAKNLEKCTKKGHISCLGIFLDILKFLEIFKDIWK